jgi:hypothetical protein
MVARPAASSRLGIQERVGLTQSPQRTGSSRGFYVYCRYFFVTVVFAVREQINGNTRRDF